MPGWRERVEAELSELQGRMERLHEFINGNPEFRRLPTVQQCLLPVQYDVMHALAGVLQSRLDADTSEAAEDV